MEPCLAYWGLEKVPGVSVIKQMPDARVVFHQGGVPEQVMLLKSGWIKLVRQEQEGQGQIIALCLPGALLGVAELIAERVHPAAAITLTKCEFHSVPAPAFLGLLKADPKLSWRIHRALCRQINEHIIHSTQHKGVSSRLRLEQLLWQLLRAQNRHGVTPNSMPGEGRLLIPLQCQELALMISITPEYLGRILREMECEGLIRRDNRQIILPDPERLWHHPEVQNLTASQSNQTEEINLSTWILT